MSTHTAIGMSRVELEEGACMGSYGHVFLGQTGICSTQMDKSYGRGCMMRAKSGEERVEWKTLGKTKG